MQTTRHGKCKWPRKKTTWLVVKSCQYDPRRTWQMLSCIRESRLSTLPLSSSSQLITRPSRQSSFPQELWYCYDTGLVYVKPTHREPNGLIYWRQIGSSYCTMCKASTSMSHCYLFLYLSGPADHEDVPLESATTACRPLAAYNIIEKKRGAGGLTTVFEMEKPPLLLDDLALRTCAPPS